MSPAVFGAESTEFLVQLTADNTKTFFDAHRDVYTRAIRQPMEDLLAEAEARYGAGRVMRPNRDVRFSANKQPYRTDASMWAGVVGGVYLSLRSDGLEVGGGLYDPSRDQLERARAAIDAQPLAASRLAAIVSALIAEGFTMAGPSLTTAPRGYDKDHPHIALLRLKHFAGLRSLPVGASRESIHAAWTSIEPLIEWTNTFVGAALNWP